VAFAEDRDDKYSEAEHDYSDEDIFSNSQIDCG